MITAAHARCAGAGRTNCSVGISDEGWKEIEAARQHNDQVAAIVFLSLLGACVVAALLGYWVAGRLDKKPRY